MTEKKKPRRRRRYTLEKKPKERKRIEIPAVTEQVFRENQQELEYLDSHQVGAEIDEMARFDFDLDLIEQAGRKKRGEPLLPAVRVTSEGSWEVPARRDVLFYKALAMNLTPKEACAVVGVTFEAYQKRFQVDPQFRRMCTQAHGLMTFRLAQKAMDHTNSGNERVAWDATKYMLERMATNYLPRDQSGLSVSVTVDDEMPDPIFT